jgi:hypothetical protein
MDRNSFSDRGFISENPDSFSEKQTGLPDTFHRLDASQGVDVNQSVDTSIPSPKTNDQGSIKRLTLDQANDYMNLLSEISDLLKDSSVWTKIWPDGAPCDPNCTLETTKNRSDENRINRYESLYRSKYSNQMGSFVSGLWPSHRALLFDYMHRSDLVVSGVVHFPPLLDAYGRMPLNFLGFFTESETEEGAKKMFDDFQINHQCNWITYWGQLSDGHKQILVDTFYMCG